MKKLIFFFFCISSVAFSQQDIDAKNIKCRNVFRLGSSSYSTIQQNNIQSLYLTEDSIILNGIPRSPLYINFKTTNTFLGYQSGYLNTTGLTNTAFGYQSGYSNILGSGNVYLGYQAGYNETGSNKLYIDNSNTTSPLIYGDFATNRIGINCNTPSTDLEIGTNTSGGNGRINATLGAELAPPLTGNSGVNWTLSNVTGYVQPFAGTIDKTGNGTGTITPTAATTIVAGVTYKVIITISAISGSTATWTLGASSGTPLIAATTYTEYITASNTDKLIITPTATALRITITSISITALTDLTGDLTVEGNLKMGGSIKSLTVGALGWNFGSRSLYQENTGGTGVNTSLFIGQDAGFNDDLTDNKNTFIGFESGETNTTGSLNTFIGYRAGKANTNGTNNVFIGNNAGSASTHNCNIAIGFSAGINLASNYNTVMGYSAFGSGARSGVNNVVIGCFAGGLTAGSGASNVFVGGSSGYKNTNGNYNVFIGETSGYENTTGASNVFLGYQAGYNETGSNKLYISNSNTATPLISGDFSTVKVGIGTTSAPTYTLSLYGTAANTIGNELNTQSNTAGLGLKIRAGGCTFGSNNKGGLGIIIKPDSTTGIRGTTKIELQSSSRTAASTSYNTMMPQFEIFSANPLVDNANDTLFSVVINSDSAFACNFDLEITVNNGTDRQARGGIYGFRSAIKTGALVTPTFTAMVATEDLGGGTLAETLTYSYVKATSTLYLIGKWDSSFNPTVGQMITSITIINMKGTSATPTQY